MRLGRSWLKRGWVFIIGLAIATWASVSLPLPTLSALPGTNHDPVSARVLAQGGRDNLPLQVHPLPPNLAQWHDSQATGDYFDQIQPVNVGYLVWSEFPIKVFVEPVESTPVSPFITQRSQTWVKAVLQAIQEWQPYLPFAIVDQAETADITIWRSTPPLRLDPESPTSQPGDRRPSRLQIRARNAETRYEIYVKPIPATGMLPAMIALAQRFTIYLRPDQPVAYTLATARHELGHALGIWGHSPFPTDALYASQVRQPPTISARDVNTLKRVYEQPTRLGWRISR